MPRKKIKYKTNPKGVHSSGYCKIDTGKIYDVVKQEWKKSDGLLFLFGINKKKGEFRLLNPSL